MMLLTESTLRSRKAPTTSPSSSRRSKRPSSTSSHWAVVSAKELSASRLRVDLVGALGQDRHGRRQVAVQRGRRRPRPARAAFDRLVSRRALRRASSLIEVPNRASSALTSRVFAMVSPSPSSDAVASKRVARSPSSMPGEQRLQGLQDVLDLGQAAGGLDDVALLQERRLAEGLERVVEVDLLLAEERLRGDGDLEVVGGDLACRGPGAPAARAGRRRRGGRRRRAPTVTPRTLTSVPGLGADPGLGDLDQHVGRAGRAGEAPVEAAGRPRR